MHHRFLLDTDRFQLILFLRNLIPMRFYGISGIFIEIEAELVPVEHGDPIMVSAPGFGAVDEVRGEDDAVAGVQRKRDGRTVIVHHLYGRRTLDFRLMAAWYAGEPHVGRHVRQRDRSIDEVAVNLTARSLVVVVGITEAGWEFKAAVVFVHHRVPVRGALFLNLNS